MGGARLQTSRSGPLPSRASEKAAWVVALLLLCGGGYYLVGLNTDPERATTLETALDRAVPLVPAFMYVYAGIYTALLYPLFVVRCQRLFRRVAVAYLVVIALELLCFWIFPVSGVALRGDVAQLDMAVLHEWGLRLNYTLDPPYNLFPSLHVSIAVLAALCAWQARPLFGFFGMLGALAIAISVCFVKQHFAVDAVAGAALAVVAWWLLVRPCRYADARPEQVAYSWRGPAGYLLVYGAFIGGLALAWQAGWAPWDV